MRKIIRVLGIPTAILTLVGTLYALQTHLDKNAPRPKAPVIEDVNRDGIPDKVLEKIVWEDLGVVIKFPTIKREILYGIGEVNGKQVYLPEDAYKRYKRGELTLP